MRPWDWKRNHDLKNANWTEDSSLSLKKPQTQHLNFSSIVLTVFISVLTPRKSSEPARRCTSLNRRQSHARRRTCCSSGTLGRWALHAAHSRNLVQSYTMHINSMNIMSFHDLFDPCPFSQVRTIMKRIILLHQHTHKLQTNIKEVWSTGFLKPSGRTPESQKAPRDSENSLLRFT